MTVKMISSHWKTNRLTIKDMTKDEILRVQALYEQGSYTHQWDGGAWITSMLTAVLTMVTYRLAGPGLNIKSR